MHETKDISKCEQLSIVLRQDNGGKRTPPELCVYTHELDASVIFEHILKILLDLEICINVCANYCYMMALQL